MTDIRIYTIPFLEIKKTEFNEKELILITKDDNIITFDAYGDCCSQSYIESIDDLDVLQNCVLNKIEVVEGHQVGSTEEDYHVKKWTFYKFFTDKGSATLSFRNESNGYYNGSLELVNVVGSNKEDLKDITLKELKWGF